MLSGCAPLASVEVAALEIKGDGALPGALLCLLAEQASDGVVVVDAEGGVRAINAEAARQLGGALRRLGSQGEVPGCTLLRPDGTPLPPEESPLGRALAGEPVREARWSVRRPDGMVYALCGVALPLRHPDGRPAGAVLLSRDETEWTRIESAPGVGEDFLQRLLRVPLPGLALTDATGRLLGANDAFLRLAGHSREDMEAGQIRWDALAAPEAPAAGAQAVDMLRRMGSTGPLETECVRPDGARVPVRVAALRLDAPERTLILVQDLTPRRRAEEALRFLSDASRELAEVRAEPDAILAGVAHLVASSVATWCLVDVLEEDGSFRRVAAAHRDPACEPLLREAPHFPFAADVAGPLFQALKSGESRLYPDFLPEHRRQMARGPDHLALMERLGTRSVMLVPMRARGRAMGLFTFASGDPGRRYGPEDLEMAEELARRAGAAVDNARLYREAQEAVSLRDEFLGIASHELKTPLTPLRLKLQMLQRHVDASAASGAPLPAERLSEALDVALRQVRKLTDLVDNLLDVSRITAGRLRLELEEVDLVALAEEIVSRFMPSAAQLGCTLLLEAPKSVVGRWDRLRVEQVVTNLLSNAIKYGAGRPVEVRVEADGDRARLMVRDHGIGIAEEDLARIFERFERAVSDRHYGGLGLGLYITRQIVEAFGGTVSAASQPGQGATFTLELPRGSRQASP